MANQLLYGFMNLKDLATRRVTEVGMGVVWDAIQATVAEHNRQMDAIMSLFAIRTSDFKERFISPTVARLQPLDDNGRARPIKTAGFYDVAYPLQAGGAAWGANYVTRAKMTVQEANDMTATLISADIRWMRDHVLAALYANASWTFTDDLKGALTVQGLANSDAVKYLLLAGADAGATDTHYLAQAAAIADGTNPFPTIFDELKEHPENQGEVLALIPSNLKATAKALAEFNAFTDPNLQKGSANDVVVGTLGVQIPGELIGYTDSKVWIAEWRSLPNDYIVAVTTDGARSLKMREHEETPLQGFNLVAQRDDHPFYESQWLRYAGFGAFNRVGAVVYRIGNASYAVPTNYGSPLA